VSTRISLIAGGALFVALLGGGCGGGGSGPGGENAAVPLSEWLPRDAPGYVAVDLAALREDLGDEEDLDPFSAPPGSTLYVAATEATDGIRGPAGETGPTDLLRILSLGEATAIAEARDSESAITAIATSADTGEIGSDLGDAGFADRGGVLLRGGDPAIRLEIGIVFVSPDPAALRTIPDEPADDAPDPLLEELEAPFVETTLGADCVRSQGASGEADGSGELALLIDGAADASLTRVAEGDRFGLGEPDADGDVVTLDANPPEGPTGFAAVEALRDGAVSYDC